MAYDSIIDGTPWQAQADQEDADNLEASKKDMKAAASRCFITVDRVGRQIHSQYGESQQVEANQAVTNMLTQLTDMLTGNAGQITNSFTVQAGATQASSRELESVRGQVTQLTTDNDELRRSAREASDLRAQVTQLEAQLRTSDSDLQAANDKVATLQQEVDKPNPLQADVTRFTSDKQALTRQLDDEKNAHEATKQENTGLREQVRTLQRQLSEAPKAPAQQPDPTPAPSGDPEHQPDEDGHNGIINGNGGLAAGQDSVSAPADDKSQDKGGLIDKAKKAANKIPGWGR